jgi:hypothetical protein
MASHSGSFTLMAGGVQALVVTPYQRFAVVAETGNYPKVA